MAKDSSTVLHFLQDLSSKLDQSANKDRETLLQLKKEEKEKRKEKKDRKRKWLKSHEQEKVDSKDGDNEDGEDEGDDWDELAREERMAKKLKRGNITQSDFDMEFSEL